MGKFVNPDNEAFWVAYNSEIYVDKTGLIEYTNRVIDTKQALICNSRPRRFGKSTTADMLTVYLRTAIIQMLSGASVEVDVNTFQNDMVSFQNKDDVITLLIHLGYLAYDQIRRTAFIPNEEIRQEFLMVRRCLWN